MILGDVIVGINFVKGGFKLVINGVVADSDKFNRLVSPSLARNPYLESSFNNCSGPLHLLFCNSTLQMPQQVTILVLLPYIPDLDGDLQYFFACHRHDKAYLKTPFMECHSEKQIEGRDTGPCHTGDFDGPSRWCISVAHYDSQYIAEWYLKKLGM